MEVTQGGGTIVAKAERVPDRFGRAGELRYPTQPGMDPFRVVYAYDDARTRGRRRCAAGVRVVNACLKDRAGLI